MHYFHILKKKKKTRPIGFSFKSSWAVWQLSKQQQKTIFPNHFTCWTGVRKDNVVSDPPRRLPGTRLCLPPPPPTPPCSGMSDSSLELWIQAKGRQLGPVPGCHRPPVSHSSRTGSYLGVLFFPTHSPCNASTFSALSLAGHMTTHALSRSSSLARPGFQELCCL